MEKKIKICGLDCANCARELQEEIEEVEGVEKANVDFISQKVTVSVSDESVIEKVKDICNNFEEVKVVEENETYSFRIEGLDCANCARELQEEIEAVGGVRKCNVDFINQKVTVDLESKSLLGKVKGICNNFEEVKVVESETYSFYIEGLDCADCAMELQEEIEKVDGVSDCNVDFIAQKVTVNLASKSLLAKVKDICNHFEEVKVVEGEAASGKEDHKKEIIMIAVSAVFFIAALILKIIFDIEYSDFDFAGHGALWTAMYWVSGICYLISYFAVGLPVLKNTAKNISKGNIFDENFLMTLASIGAVAMGELMEGAAVMLLYQIGELLQTIAVESSRNSISTLMDLKSESATVKRGDDYVTVTPEELAVGDIIQVKNGEKVPTDAKIIKGHTSFDTKSLTGEALPKDCTEGDDILSGYINTGSVIEAEVTKAYEDSTIAKILDMVENSSATKAKQEKFITKFAKFYTPIVCCLALFVAAVVPLILSLINGNWGDNYFNWIYKSLTLLVISCPCAIVISVPLTYFGGVGVCAKHGVLVKGTTYLDLLTQVEVAAFDKTGTLTEGSFKVVNFTGGDEVLRIAAIAEKGSNHPIARAFDYLEAKDNAEELEEVSGKGLIAVIDGKKYYVGNSKLLNENSIAFEKVESVSTIIYVADEKTLLGYVEIDDSIKEDTQAALKELKELGVKNLVMLTGDNKARAKAVGDKLGLDTVYGELLPGEKLEKAEELKKQGKLLYVGDGINDAPVMMTSDVAVSMGQLGSDAAIEASDIVLISDNLSEVPNAIRTAKKTRNIVYENIIGSIALKVTFMVAGIIGLPLWIAIFGDVGVMLLAVVNSLRVRIERKTK